MEITDVFRNLSKDVERFSKNKKKTGVHESFAKSMASKKRFHYDGNESFATGESIKDSITDYDLITPSLEHLECFGDYIDERDDGVVITQDGLLPISDEDSLKELRIYLGKTHPPISNAIGCHPDFKDLEKPNSKPVTGYTVTLFLDIIGSTQLAAEHELIEVYHFKNNVITGAIQAIRAFDGHVHRIMGDAVMAFFRSKDNEKENRIKNSAIDAINCASYFIELMDKVVTPQVQSEGMSDVGIRIGIDIGDKNGVLWSNYGVIGINEVTATSFFVDVASKLQHNAPKNSIMLGRKICETLGLIGSPFINVKEDQRFVVNVMDRFKYEQFIFNQKEYFRHLPHGERTQNSPIKVKTFIGEYKDDSYLKEHLPCSSFVRTGKWIKFDVEVDLQHLPRDLNHETSSSKLHFIFTVENTGEDAQQHDKNDNHKSDVDAEIDNGKIKASHWESTSYTGLHYMKVSLYFGDMELTNEREVTIFISK